MSIVLTTSEKLKRCKVLASCKISQARHRWLGKSDSPKIHCQDGQDLHLYHLVPRNYSNICSVLFSFELWMFRFSDTLFSSMNSTPSIFSGVNWLTRINETFHIVRKRQEMKTQLLLPNVCWWAHCCSEASEAARQVNHQVTTWGSQWIHLCEVQKTQPQHPKSKCPHMPAPV